MNDLITQVQSPLFEGIRREDFRAMLRCIGYHQRSYRRGETVAFEAEELQHLGILLSGAVDMIKEDIWGGKTLLLRMHRDEMFGETFVCGSETASTVTFTVAEDATILFLPFRKVMHTCSMACEFHQRLTENMVGILAAKNRELIRKIEVISKKTLREKILAYLSIQAQRSGSRYFEIPLGRLELADYLCADRSALSRELSSMRGEGLIDYDKNMFRIL